MHHSLCLEFQRVFTLYFTNNMTCIQCTLLIITYNEKHPPSSLPFPSNKAKRLLKRHEQIYNYFQTNVFMLSQ